MLLQAGKENIIMVDSRADLKARAKDALRSFYWKGVLVCLIAAILGGGTSGSGGSISAINRDRTNSLMDGMQSSEALAFALIILTVALVVALVVVIWVIFVGNVVSVGKIRFFMESSEQQGTTGIGRLFFGFSGGNYLNIVGTMFCKGLFTTLWSFLFIIPGIYKHYEYYMVPYILAENPGIERTEAFRASKELMDGVKFSTWVLELSFIGWYLLGSLLCGFGVLFVHPYYEMTLVELYRSISGYYQRPTEEIQEYSDMSTGMW